MAHDQMKLYIFRSGTMHLPDKTILTGGIAEGKTFTIPVLCYLVVHPRGLALFDTGMNLKNWSSPNKEIGEQRPEQMIDKQLIMLGFKPEDIKYVILSHMHTDHVGGLALFPNATCVVRKNELRAAWWPESFQCLHYNLTDYLDSRNFKFIQLGDTEDFDVFLDGSVMCVDTKGHTQGHQSLLVTLQASGKMLLSVDATALSETLHGNMPPGIVWNGETAMRAIEKIRHLEEEGVFVVMGHDPDQSKTLRLAPDCYN